MRLADLFEMATPTEEMRGQRFYHGVGSTTAAESIMREGLKGTETQGRSQLAPIKGRVYMTASLQYAIMYALGGNYHQNMIEGTHLNRDGKIDPFGYVFVIDGKDLRDIQPDEDSVGGFLNSNSESLREPWKKADGTIAMQPGGTPFMKTTGYRCSVDKSDKSGLQIYWYIQANVTKQQYDRILDGQYAYFAAGGKRVLQKMPDWMKVELINRGSHIAHGGSIMPSECWKIEKDRMKEMKKDGSNFFTIAERIK